MILFLIGAEIHLEEIFLLPKRKSSPCLLQRKSWPLNSWRRWMKKIKIWYKTISTKFTSFCKKKSPRKKTINKNNQPKNKYQSPKSLLLKRMNQEKTMRKENDRWVECPWLDLNRCMKTLGIRLSSFSKVILTPVRESSSIKLRSTRFD